MQLGIITPIAKLEQFAEKSHYHLVLAHLVEKGGPYVDFYRKMAKRGDFITLDNSSFEVGDGRYTPEQLINLAHEVNASEVMAPESFPNANKCVALSSAFLDKFYACGHVGKLGVFATAHGQTPEDLKWCINKYLGTPGITTIGLSCRMDFPNTQQLQLNWNESTRKAMVRAQFVSSMQSTFAEAGKPVHLLGLNHPIELFFYHKNRDYNFIRSNDSSAAYLAGTKMIYMDRMTYEKIPEPINFHETRKLTRTQIDYIDANIIFWNTLAQ